MYHVNKFLAEKLMGWTQVNGLKVWATGGKDHNNKTEVLGFYQWSPLDKEDQAFRLLGKFLAQCEGKVSYQLTNSPNFQHTCRLFQDEVTLIKITDTSAAMAISKAIYETMKNWEGR